MDLGRIFRKPGESSEVWIIGNGFLLQLALIRTRSGSSSKSISAEQEQLERQLVGEALLKSMPLAIRKKTQNLMRENCK
jgi:hypothetical protein